jgi:hypothetical protein
MFSLIHLLHFPISLNTQSAIKNRIQGQQKINETKEEERGMDDDDDIAILANTPDPKNFHT